MVDECYTVYPARIVLPEKNVYAFLFQFLFQFLTIMGGLYHCGDRPAGTLFQVLVLNVLCGFLDVSLDGFVTYRLTQRGRFERVSLLFSFVIGCRIDNAVIGFSVHFPFHFLRLYIIYR